MALIKQISSIVNDAFKETVDPLTLTSQIDTSTLVSMGNVIEKFDLYEQFYKKLTNRIVKTVYFMRVYSPRKRSVLRDEHEYGAFVQKVYYKMPEAVDDAAYDVTEDAVTYKQASPYDIETVIEVDAQIFGGQGVWSYEIIRPLVQMKTAFTSDANMLAFISGIYTAIENRMNKDIENLENVAVATSIANTCQHGVARNLLKEYNDAHAGATLTVAQALESPDFLRFASKEINKVIKFMGELTTAFNVKGYETFTTRDNLVVEILSHFAEASKFYLQSDVYHNTLTELPRYEEVPFWQALDKTQSFDVCSSINIKNDGLVSDEPSNPTGVVEQAGVIAFLHDVENVACYFGERRTWEMMNPRSDVMIHGEKARKGYAVDGHANSVVFFLKAD